MRKVVETGYWVRILGTHPYSLASCTCLLKEVEDDGDLVGSVRPQYRATSTSLEKAKSLAVERRMWNKSGGYFCDGKAGERVVRREMRSLERLPLDSGWLAGRYPCCELQPGTPILRYASDPV